jgi:uncharacterized protein YukE
VSPPVRLCLAALAVALGLAGCGGNSAADFKKGYVADRAELKAFGVELGQAIAGSRGSSDSAIQAKFDALAGKLDTLRAKFAGLKPASNVRDNLDTLGTGLKTLEQSLRNVATAASHHDARAARAAGAAIASDAGAIKLTTNAIASQLGLPKS